MSNRQSILAALAHHGTSTYDDLEKSTGIQRNKLRWTCHDLKKLGHIAQTEDAITREVAWKITPAGRHALASEKPGDDMQQTPAGGGEITPAAAHPARRVATGRKRTASLPEGAANPIEPATRDETPAAPGSGHDGGRIAADIIGSFEDEVADLKEQIRLKDENFTRSRSIASRWKRIWKTAKNSRRPQRKPTTRLSCLANCSPPRRKPSPPCSTRPNMVHSMSTASLSPAPLPERSSSRPSWSPLHERHDRS